MDESARLDSRRRFIEKYRHELAGLVLDGASILRTGAEFALWARTTMHRTDTMLAKMFDGLFPEPPPTNGGKK